MNTKKDNHKKQDVQFDDLVQVFGAVGLYGQYNLSIGRACLVTETTILVRFLDGDKSIPKANIRKISESCYMTTMHGGNKK